MYPVHRTSEHTNPKMNKALDNQNFSSPLYATFSIASPLADALLLTDLTDSTNSAISWGNNKSVLSL